MKVPVISARRDRSRKAIESAAIAKTMHAVGQSLVETGTLDASEVSKSFGPGATAPMSAARAVGSAVVGPATGWSPTGALSSKLASRLQQNLASGFSESQPELEEALAVQGLTWGPPFPPGRPLDPFFGVRRPPRTFDYPVGANVQLTPRSNRVSFPTIKAIYDAYDVAQICVRHLINDVRSLDYNWEPIPGIKADVADEIEQAIAFFDSPDKRQPFRTWIAEWLQDVLRYDAGALYIRRNEADEPIALEVVSGSTIIPLIDYYGRRPEDENDENVDPEGLFGGEVTPAFVQIIEGLPWDWLAADDLLYLPWNPLPESQYGLSPIEAVLLSANTDIRFQWHFLNFFTEGTMPAGFMEAPPDMSDPAQIASMQEAWDALMQGDQTKLRQIRWVPSGAKFTEAKPAANKFDSEFPLYLMRRTCASYGVTPNDLGFTENVNRATGDTQIDVQFRVGTSPLLRYVEDVINLFVKQHLKLRVRIRFDDGKETEDRVAAAQAAGIYLDHGVIGIDEVRSELGQPIDKSKPSPRYINNTRVGPIPLLALESMAGKIDSDTLGVADSQALVDTPFVAAPGVVPPAGSPELKQSAETTGEQANALRAATNDTGSTTEEPAEGAQEGEEEAATETPIDKMLKDLDALLTKVESGGITAATGVQGADLVSDEDDDDDEEEAATKAAATALALRRWRENSRNRLKKGRAPRKFVDSNLSPETHNEIWAKLEKAKTRVQVDAAFKASPKAKPARPAFHHNADAIVEHYSPEIAAALGKLFSASALKAAYKAAEGARAKKDAIHEPPNLRPAPNPTAESCGNCMMYQGGQCWGYGGWQVEGNQVCDSWEQSQESKATKAAEPDPVAAAAIKSLEAASASPKALEAALRDLYGDGFLQGAHDAAAAAHGSILASLTDIEAQPDAAYWDAWVPGYGEAAALAADGGMADLLDRADITIQGLTDTGIERIGNTISDGLGKGDSYEATAKALEDVTGSRAEVIANTEYNRAMTTASVQTYEAAGIEEVEWLAESDACPECEENADASPYPLDGGAEPPEHPSCRCALAPVVNLDVPAEAAEPTDSSE